MRFVLVLFFLAVLWHESAALNQDVILQDPKVMAPAGVYPLYRTRRDFLGLQQYHGYFMSDGTVQLWTVNPGPTYSFRLIVTWNLPKEMRGMDTYYIQVIQTISAPYPTVSWYAAKGNRIWRFQCGPGTLCYRTAPDLFVPGVNASLPIQAFIQVNDNGRAVGVTTDYVVVVDEAQTNLILTSTFSWKDKPFRQNFPVDLVTGFVPTGSDGGDVLIALSPRNPTGVGYVLALGHFGGQYYYKRVTMMQRATRTFNAWQDTNGRPIYYWLEQLPHNGTSSKNAFVKSQGGSRFDAQEAGTVFGTSEVWDNFFAADVQTRTGLLISGTLDTAGFTAWSPAFGFGECVPEVKLRQRSIIPASKGFTMPIMGSYLSTNLRRMAAVSMNVHDNRYYLIVLDWSQTPLPICYVDSEKEEQTRQLASQNSPRRDMNLSEALFKPNCVPSNCKLDTSDSDCPDEHCWGLGGQGGFYCCDHPPA